MKRFVALAVVLVALAAVGCGSDESSNTTSTSSSTKPITLTVWDWSVPDPAAMKPIDDAYMADHPNVTIKRVHHPFATYTTLVRSAVAARKGPDVITSYASPFIFDFKNGLEPLNDLRTPEDTAKLDGWDYLKSGDDYLGMPYTANGTMFYYNKALFRKAGLDPEAAPTTWDELLTTCEKLKAAGITPIVAGWKDGYYAEWWTMQLMHQYQTDEELAKATSDPDWASPSIGKAFELMTDLYKRGCFTPNSDAVPLFPNAVEDFKAAKGAIFLGLSAGDIHWGQFGATKWGKDLGAFLPPIVPDSLWTEQRINHAPAISYGITKWAPDKQAAYDYISYLASAPAQDKLFETAGAFSNNADANPTITDPVASEIFEWIKTKEHFAGQMTLIRANVEAEFDKLIPQIITGEKSYDDDAAKLVAVQDKSAAAAH